MEAINAILNDLSRQDAKKIFCAIRNSNAKSKQILELFTFELEGHLKMTIHTAEGYFDELIYGKKLERF